MLLYRVFPYLPTASEGEPGHPTYRHPDQGFGRWDNPDLYLLGYFAERPEAAIGESLAHLSTWTDGALEFPQLPRSQRMLATVQFDEEAGPVLDLDDAKALLAWNLRPTEVVIRDRPRTQRLARAVFAEGRWAGLRWWSLHRPQWGLLALWSRGISVQRISSIPGHAAAREAARILAKNYRFSS